MCGSKGNSSTTSASNSTSTSTPSAIAQEGYNLSSTGAVNAAEQPYQYYQGQLVAGFTPDQYNAMAQVDNSTNIANPYINNAATLTQSATQPIGASQINQYMNPYISDVVGTTASEINQNNAVQQNQLQGNAAALGALGGNREGLAAATLANQQDLAENNTLSGLYSSGYNTALGAAQTTNAQQLQGAALDSSLGSEAQNTALAGANAELQVGSQEQQQQQNNLNAAYSQWSGAQQYPFQTANFLSGIESGLGSLEGGTSTNTGNASTTPPKPSTFSQVMGGIGSVAGIAGMLLAKKGGRIEREFGGASNAGQDYFPILQAPAVAGQGLPNAPSMQAPAAIDPNQKKNSGGGGGMGGMGSILGMLGSSGGGLGGMAQGGVAKYDGGGGVAYDETYFPQLAAPSGHGTGLPQAMPMQAPTPASGGSNSSGGSSGNSNATSAENTVKALQGLQASYKQNNGGLIGDVMRGGPGTAITNPNNPPSQAWMALSDPSMYFGGLFGGGEGALNGGLGALYAHGGRTERATGGTTNGGTPYSAAPSSTDNAAPTIAPGTETPYEQLIGYQELGSLLPTGQVPHPGPAPSAPAQNPVMQDQQMLQQGLAHGGLARMGRADGGAGVLPAFNPVGGQNVSAPSAATTAGSSVAPTAWGSVQMPTAPQLNTAQPMTTASSIDGAVNTYAGGFQPLAASNSTQNPYVSYIEGLPGSNPSAGNVAQTTGVNGNISYPSNATITGNVATPNPLSPPGIAAAAAKNAPAPAPAVLNPGFLQATSHSRLGVGAKSGGRIGYDDGGGIASAAPIDLTQFSGVPAPPVVPVQQQALPLASSAPTPQTVAPAPTGIAAASPARVPPQGLQQAASASPPTTPAPASAGLSAASSAPQTSAAQPAMLPAAQQFFQGFARMQDQIESGGNPTIHNPQPGQTASGLGQFTDPTWAQVVASTDPALVKNMTPAQIEALKNNATVNQDMTANYAIQNAQYLTRQGLPANFLTLSLAHRFGPTGAATLLTSSAADPTSEVFDKQTLQANPDLEGLTVGDVVQNTAREIAKFSGAANGAGAQPQGTQVAQNDYQPPAWEGIPSQAPGMAQLQPLLNQPVNVPQMPPSENAKIANSPWAALAAAGFATMANNSPYTAVNIGQGGLAALQYMKDSEGQERQQATTGADIAAQNITANQNQENLGLAGVGRNIEQEQVGTGLQTSMAGLGPAYTNAGIAAEQNNLFAAATGQPQFVPGQTNVPYFTPMVQQPAGAGPVAGPQTSGAVNAPAVGGVSPQEAQAATGLPPSAPSTVDTRTMVFGNVAPFANQYAKAQQMALSGNKAAQDWLAGPAAAMLNQPAVQETENVANSGQQQIVNLQELSSEAEKAGTGPITGPISAQLYEGYEDLRNAAGLPSDASVNAQSDAYQIIPKLTAQLQAAMTKATGDQGGAELYRQVSPAIPSIVNTPTGLQEIVRTYTVMQTRNNALASFVSAQTQQGKMPFNQAVQAFNQLYPPSMWASHVLPRPLPASVNQLLPGYAYQSNNSAAMWNGNTFVRLPEAQLAQ